MIHNFNIEVAKIVWIEWAVILYNIEYWINKNKANEKNFHDGSYWTYNSKSAFMELFPYMKESTIRRTLENLISEWYLKIGNYNKSKMDRTKRYSLTTKYLSIWQNQQMQVAKSTNASGKINQPIPDSKPDSKPNKKTIVTQAELDEKFGCSLQDVVYRWNDLYDEYKLPRVMKITDNLKDQWRLITEKYTKEELNAWVMSYLRHIDGKIKKQKAWSTDWYLSHRFSLYKFLKQDNWLQEFINNQ